ncbi:hypothetical protein E1286_35660 [Nonomuraea terrae]|uniref:Uncharacterized protein n=1 Tax=Nonomuraea terrae TaxID=2530383 RepID=A0A4R4Y4F0_9ACTN|nr:hypothetical protein [Nonomuraea terrae]TDD39125.1 hypothetical protein E1286_35660 [Nonomuraea terrae]
MKRRCSSSNSAGAGSLGVLAWFAFFLLPVVVVVLERAVAGVALGPLAWQFWWALLCTGLLLGQESLAFVLAGREYVRRFAAWRRSRQ